MTTTLPAFDDGSQCTSEDIALTPSCHRGTIPAELTVLPQWVCWRQALRNDRMTKIPVNPHTGGSADTTDSMTWGTLAEACEAAQRYQCDGIGFVFTATDPYVGVDLDKCRDRNTGALEPWATEIVQALQTYTEVSTSGTGVHCLLRGTLPGSRRRKGQIEMYDTARFFVMTGQCLPEIPQTLEARQGALDTLYAQVFQTQHDREPTLPTRPPLSTEEGLSDTELLARAQSALNGEKFTRLWNGDWLEYESQSEADLALCALLAFWTGDDAERIDWLFRQSGLYRDKWEREDYAERTIAYALDHMTDFYTPVSASAEDEERLPSLPASCEPYTDLGNTRRFVHWYRDTVRYSGKLGWLLWNGQYWAMDESGRINVLAEETVRRIEEEACDVTDDKERKALHAHAKQSQHHARLKAMVERAQHQPELVIKQTDLDTDPWLLNVQNGTIDLRTGELRAHRRDDYITKMIPIMYDSDAQCPQWLQFLHEIMCGNEDMVTFLQRAVGYSLTGRTTEQCFFILYGTGANGKGVFVNVLKNLLGEYARTAEFNTFMESRNETIRNDLARLAGARFVVASEGESGHNMSESIIKTLTGEDTCAARFLHKEHFEFVPTFKIFLATNHKPHIKNQDNGIWRRMRLIPFTKTIPTEDQNQYLAEELLTELPGILRWAVKGCLAWQDMGLQPPAIVLEATEDYRQDMDDLAPFLDACFDMGEEYRTPSSEIHTVYDQWCQRTNIKRPLSQRSLISKLKERGFFPYHTRDERGLKGLQPCPVVRNGTLEECVAHRC